METVIVAFATTLATSVATIIATLLQSYISKRQGNNKALMILLRQYMTQLYNAYQSKRTLTIEEYEEFMEIYEVYHGLGGNGTGTHMMQEIEKKKIKESE